MTKWTDPPAPRPAETGPAGPPDAAEEVRVRARAARLRAETAQARAELQQAREQLEQLAARLRRIPTIVAAAEARLRAAGDPDKD